MSVSKIRGFLLQLPKPAAVRVTAEGEPQLIKVGKSYAKLAETIDALGVELVEALDKDGATVLRAMRLGTVESQRSSASELPEVLKQDPQAAMFTHFANLLHRAYEHSSEIAFTKMVEVFDIMNVRSDSIERRLERAEADRRALLQQQVDDAIDQAEERAERAAAEAGGGDVLSNIAGAFLSGKAAAAPASNGKATPNGKGGH